MTRHDFECWTCLDFAYLPEIGPCPDCQPDAYTEHVTEWLGREGEEEAA